jgi:protein transport protein SEC24
MTSLPHRRMDAVREELSDACASLLLGYRRNCAVATQPSQLILPEAFKALPAYTLGLLKTKPLKGRTVASDVRNYHRHRLLGMSCQNVMNYLYPRVLALHDLDDRIALPDPEHGGRIWFPTHMRASYTWMEGHGIYLLGESPPPSTSCRMAPGALPQ